MISAEMLNMMDQTFRLVEGKQADLPFGGVRIIMAGDFFQCALYHCIIGPACQLALMTCSFGWSPGCPLCMHTCFTTKKILQFSACTGSHCADLPNYHRGGMQAASHCKAF